MGKKYLGEFPVPNLTGTPYANFSPTDWALTYISSYGQIDGAHHKQWVLDQVTRILLGTPIELSLAKWDDGTQEYRHETGEPSEAYLKWVEDYKDGDEYFYEEGITP